MATEEDGEEQGAAPQGVSGPPEAGAQGRGPSVAEGTVRIPEGP